MKNVSAPKGNFLALLPLVLFVSTFLGAGIYLNDFYAFPSPLAVVLGISLAFLIFKDSIEEKVNTLLKGCGDEKIMTMCLIYLLAGGFTAVCEATGSVDAVVNLSLKYISVEFIYVGIFVVSSFLSFSTGTSVGAIVALVAIVMSFAERTGAAPGILSASLLGGAMFGDNLSFISDTTIAATQTQGVAMKDKFRENFRFALPAALITLGILFYQGLQLDPVELVSDAEVQWVKIMPYLMIISLAIAGMNVFVVLFLGLLVAGVTGILSNDFGWLEFANYSYEGFVGMIDIFLLSMLTGGLAALVTRAGGLDYISGLFSRKSAGQSAYLGIGGLVGLTNLAIANNTVSILVSGTIARKISDQLNLKGARVASVLDIVACVVQGILPYGAQILLLLSFSGGQFGYFELVGNAWYLWFLLGGLLLHLSLRTKKREQAASSSVEAVIARKAS